MRLFIAVNMDDAMRKALSMLQNEARSLGVAGNYTRPENLHLTLAFIGEYAYPEKVLSVIHSMPSVPKTLTFSGLGAFDDIWWIGAEKDDALSSCVRQLRCSLKETGIPFDQRDFVPHVTLIRKARCQAGQLPSLHIPKLEMKVDHIALMRSDTAANGVVYTEIRE